MKKMLFVFAMSVLACAWADTWTDPETGVIWEYAVDQDQTAILEGADWDSAMSQFALDSLTIPSAVGGYPVTSIGDWAFGGCGFERITIPAGVTYLGEGVFCGCESLTEVSLPSGLTGIGNSAFSCCYKLKEITIPSSVTDIGDCAFRDCSGLTSVTIPSGVTNIGDCAFADCTSLTSVTIPSSVTEIGDYAFAGCYKIHSATVPGCQCQIDFSSVTNLIISEGTASIGECAFYGCIELTSVEIPSSVTNIGECAFRDCSGLGDGVVIVDGCVLCVNGRCPVTVELPQGTRLISGGAFSDCSELTSVTMPEGLVHVGDYAFAWCYSLNNADLPSSVENIGKGAFCCCESLTEMEVPTGITCIEDRVFESCGELRSVRLPEGLTSIGNSAFDDCHNLRQIAIPSSVTNIGNSAFGGCIGLTSVTIPSSVANIGDSAFSVCSGLQSFVVEGENYKSVNGLLLSKDGTTLICGINGSVTIPNGVTCVADSAFSGRSGLTSVEIPSSVTNIGGYAFSNCSGLKNIVIPLGVTSIGNSAFRGCSGLTSVTIPPSVTNIGGYAFSNCSGLKNIVISSGVVSIGNSAFYGCSGLTSVTIPSSAANIGDSTFAYCSGLKSVVMPSGVASIGNSAFRGCSGLTSVTIPSSVTNIGGCAFSNCSGLKNIVIPSGVVSIGNSAFSSCSGLTSVTIPSSVTSIGDSAFAGCSGLRSFVVEGENYKSVNGLLLSKDGTTLIRGINGSVTIPNGVTCVADSAFSGCSGLTSVEIPSSVTNIGGYAFANCGGLKNIVISSGVVSIGNSAFSGCSGLTSVEIPAGVTSIGGGVFAYCTSLTRVTIPASVTSIGAGAFRGCSAMAAYDVEEGNENYKVQNGLLLSKDGKVLVGGINNGAITIPDGVTSIDAETFYGCSGLISVTIPSSATSIGDSAFANCGGLKSIVIPFGVVSIGNSAFRGCSGLTSVEIPSSVTCIGYSAFYGCSGLKFVSISDVGAWCGISFGGYGSNPLLYAKKLCVNGVEVSNLVIPEGVTSIGGSAFAYCKSLTSVEMSASVTSIGYSAFSGCSGLTSVEIPSSVTEIGDYAFEGCGLLRVDIPFGVTHLGEGVFCGCDQLSEVSLPSGLTSIGNSAFDGCCNLWRITIPSSVTEIGDYAFEGCGLWRVDIPAGVTYLGEVVFCGCDQLTEVSLPSGVMSIGNSAFDGCRNLRRIMIPSSVTEIGDYAFAWCELERIKIPSSVTYLGEGAFYGCNNLSKVYFEGDAPIVGSENIYEETSHWEGLTTYVSKGSVGWSEDGSSDLPYEWYGHCIKHYRSCRVRFDAQGGTCSQPVRKVPVSEWIGDLPTAEREGYLFLGWYTAAAGGCRVTAYSKPPIDVVYYAHWFKEDPKGACPDAAVAVTPGSSWKTAEAALVPEYDSSRGTYDADEGVYYYTFTLKRGEGGCFSILGAGSSSRSSSSPHFGVDNSELWIDSVDCLTGDAPSLDDDYYDYYGDYFGVISPSAWEGHFAASATYVVRISGDVDTAFNFTYKTFNGFVPLFLDGNGGGFYWDCDWESLVETVVEHDAPVGDIFLSSYPLYYTPYRFGYTFDGWYTAPVGGSKITAKTVVSNDAGTTWYAHWKTSKKTVQDKFTWSSALTVGSSWKESTNTLSPQYWEDDWYDYEGVYYYTFTLPRGSGCMLYRTLNGLYLDDDWNVCIDYVESAGDSDAPSFDCHSSYAVLYPEAWDGYGAAKVGYTVRVCGSVGQEFTLRYKIYNGSCDLNLDCQGGGICDGNGGTTDCLEVGVERGGAIGKEFLDSYVPKLAKHTFDGWYTAPVGGTKITAKTVVSIDATWYAHWTYDGSAHVGVSVCADCADMGTVSGGNKNFKAGEKVALKATAKKGYVFAGWHDADGNPLSGEVDYRTPSYTYLATGEDDVALFAKFLAADDDWAEIGAEVRDEYETGEPIEPIAIEVDSGSLATVKVSGLPTGLKFTAKALDVKATKTTPAAHYEANTIYGTPTKSGVYVVTVTATTVSKKSVSKSVKFIVRATGETLVDADWDSDLGKVTGVGICAKGKSLTLKATANKGYVFAGWYQDAAFTVPAEGAVDYRTTSFAVTGNGKDQKLYARFVPTTADQNVTAVVAESYDLNGPWTKKLDIESLSLPTVTVKGLPTGLKFDAKTLTISGTPTKPGTYAVTLSLKNVTVKTAKTQTLVLNVANIESPHLAGVSYEKGAYVYRGGVAVGWDIGACAQDGYSVSAVAGLPAGLKFNAKTGMIEGVPTKAGTFTATITLKKDRDTSPATITMNVEAIDAWAYGTFNGGSDSGQVQLAITSAGKLTGKHLEDGVSYTLAAPSFASYKDGAYQVHVTASWSYKEGNSMVKKSEVWPIVIEEGAIGGIVSSDYFDAWQNVWSQAYWKQTGTSVFGQGGTVKTLTGDVYGLQDGESVVLTIKANGSVTVKGTFDTGTLNRQGMPVYYSASGSSVVCATSDDPFAGLIFVYFAPNASKSFGGYVRVVHVDE